MQKFAIFVLLSCLLAMSVADRIMYPTKYKSVSSSSSSLTGTQTNSNSGGGLNMKIPLTPSDKKQTYYIKCTVSTSQQPQCQYLGTSLK